MISVEKRRVSGNFIEMFKMSKNSDLFNNTFKFRKSESSRGNKLAAFKTRCWLNISKKFFNYRLVDIWNKLPDGTILSNSLYSFKSILDKINYCTYNYVSWYTILASWVFLFVVCSVLWPYYYLNLLFSSINCLLARNLF